MAESGEKDCLNLSFRAQSSAASAGIKMLGGKLSELGLPEGKADDVKIAVTEAINNVVEHAYARTTPMNVDVSCRICPCSLKVIITDTGHPMPNFTPPDGTPASVETELQDLPEGGFGWFLIRRLSSEVRYERKEGQNQLVLRFNLTSLS